MAAKTNPVTGAPNAPTGFDREIAIATAPAWRPAPTDRLVGIPIGSRIGHTEEYDDYPVIIFQTTEGEYLSFHAFHKLSQERLYELKEDMKAAALARTPMTLVYLGEKVTNATKDKAEKDQINYHSYYIRMGTPDDVPASAGFDF